MGLERPDLHDSNTIEAELKGLVERFRHTAQESLARIGQSLGAECLPGHYDSVMSAARSARSGTIQDGAGRLEYRFHGSGCEVIKDGAVVDFNIYPKRQGVSPIMSGAFGFRKFLDSVGFEVEDEDTVVEILDEAATRGWVTRLDAARPCYSFSSCSGQS